MRGEATERQLKQRENHLLSRRKEKGRKDKLSQELGTLSSMSAIISRYFSLSFIMINEKVNYMTSKSSYHSSVSYSLLMCTTSFQNEKLQSFQK